MVLTQSVVISDILVHGSCELLERLYNARELDLLSGRAAGALDTCSRLEWNQSLERGTYLLSS
jgi:hypothetical protein